MRSLTKKGHPEDPESPTLEWFPALWLIGAVTMGCSDPQNRYWRFYFVRQLVNERLTLANFGEDRKRCRVTPAFPTGH